MTQTYIYQLKLGGKIWTCLYFDLQLTSSIANLTLGAWGRRSQAKEIEILWADHFLLAILNILPRSGVFRLVPRASREAFRLVPRAIKLGKLVYFFNPLQCCLKSSQVRLIKA